MILEIMQHHYLAQTVPDLDIRIGRFLALARANDPEALGVLGKFDVGTSDVAHALDQLREASGALTGAKNDDPAYFARDPRISQIQSALQRYFLDNKLIQKNEAAGASMVSSPVSDVSLAASVMAQPPSRLFGKMSETDVGWLACLTAMGFRRLAGRRKFPEKPADPQMFADNARVYLIGDWGSGVTRAKKIADRVRAMLETERTRPQHVIHLGDVYYSGWPEEYDEHLLAHWPVRPGEEQKYGSWCLNGNHDMYSGGFGFFDHLLKDTRFKAQQQSSYFSLENTNWQILGLDSAWKDEDLAGGQADWVEQRQAAHKDKKLILMTHHQPFSAFEKDCVALQPLMQRNKVTAWFWGHEHRFAMYKARPDLPYGRLIGHSGVPVWVGKPSTSPIVEYVSTRGFRSAFETFALFGFAVMDFAGEKIDIRYFDEHGQVERSETIQ